MKLFTILSLLLITAGCKSQPENNATVQSRLVGGPCEICDYIEGYDEQALRAVDTLPDFDKSAQKLKITGTIYQPDGKTPAENVILFIYHTNEAGIYQRVSEKDKPGENYVYHRGWIKTGEDGHYAFYTFMPGIYPSRTEPRHIHPLIREPDGKVYYIDAFVFDDDPLLTAEEKSTKENRGGSGILHLDKSGALYTAEKDIILGLNVPGYN